MESSFRAGLLEKGIDEAAMEILIEQKVTTERVFLAMKEDHIVRLLECHGMAVGSHVLLWKMWERGHVRTSIMSRSSRLSLGKKVYTWAL